ncbi:MAG: dihydrolipoyl dehydrogenase [Leptospirales bacterium]
MNSLKSDVVIIGAGPGGYAAAFLAADLGMQVSIVDPEAHPGGVCLYRGCIASKALLHAAKVLSDAEDAKQFGLNFGNPQIDLSKLRNWKDDIILKLTSGLSSLTKSRNITYIQGYAKFRNSNELEIRSVSDEKSDDFKVLTFQKAIIATGSKPAHFPYAPLSESIMDSTMALQIKNIPKTLLVVGAGYIGLELGSVYANLGSEVTIVEAGDTLLPAVDRDLVAVFAKKQKNLFKEILLSVKVEKLTQTDHGAKAQIVSEDGEEKQMFFDKILSAIGRNPNSQFLGLENTNVKTDEKGFIQTDETGKTFDENIYAIGDVTGEPMLAHAASAQGKIAAEAIAGENVIYAPRVVPAVIFTDPQIAWCGITQSQAKTMDIEVVRFPWGASGRALTMNRTDGLTKLFIDRKSKRILGMGIAGPEAGEMIAEGVLAIEMGAVAGDIGMSIHAHPTLSETVMEGAESFFGQATHLYRPQTKTKPTKDTI